MMRSGSACREPLPSEEGVVNEGDGCAFAGGERGEVVSARTARVSSGRRAGGSQVRDDAAHGSEMCFDDIHVKPE